MSPLPRVAGSGAPFETTSRPGADAVTLSAREDRSDIRRTLAGRLGVNAARLTAEFRRARQTVFRRGDYCEEVCVILEGWGYRSFQLADGRRQILSFLLPGDVMNGAAPIQPRLDYSVQTLTNLRYVRLSSRLFAPVHAQAELTRELAKVLVADRKSADDQMINLGRRRADERVAGLILRLRDRLDERGEVENESFSFPLRQQHIADATGLTAVHVSRVFTQLRRNGLVETRGGMIHLLDLAELRRLGDLG
jgi:CRP-like cAMP-binding protein